jgi:hypothetical protein
MYRIIIHTPRRILRLNMRGVKYVMQIEHDPSGVFDEGVRLPYIEFLTGLDLGVFPEGLKVSRRAETSEFVVAVSSHGNYYLSDRDGHHWLVERNSGNASGYQLRHDIPHDERFAKHE